MSREQFQRLALVTLVVLLTALASERLMAMVRPPCAPHHDRLVHVRVHAPPMAELPPMADLAALADVQAELAAEAQRMGEEARRLAEEHRRLAGERCRIERERVVVVR